MTELAQLVKRYAKGEIDYRTFRREFVVQFLSVSSNYPVLETAVAKIESLCADVAEGLISSESELKNNLQELVRDSVLVISRPMSFGDFEYFSPYLGTSTMLQFAAVPVSQAWIRVVREKEFA